MNALPEQLVLLVAIGHIRKMSQEAPECTQNLNKKQKNFLQKIKWFRDNMQRSTSWKSIETIKGKI